MAETEYQKVPRALDDMISLINDLPRALDGNVFRDISGQLWETWKRTMIDAGYTDIQVEMAKGPFKDLQARLDAMDADTRNFNVNWINKNLGKLDQTFMTDQFLQQMAGNTPINAVPSDGSLTTPKYADESVTKEKLSDHVKAELAKSDSTFVNLLKNSELIGSTGWARSTGANWAVTDNKIILTGNGSNRSCHVQQKIDLNTSQSNRLYVRVNLELELTKPVESLSVIVFSTVAKSNALTKVGEVEQLISGGNYLFEGVIDVPASPGDVFYIRYEAVFANNTAQKDQVVKVSKPIVVDVTASSLKKREIIDFLGEFSTFHGALSYHQLSDFYSKKNYEENILSLPAAPNKYDTEINTVYLYSDSQNPSSGTNYYTNDKLMFDENHTVYTAQTNSTSKLSGFAVPIKPVKIHDYDYIDIYYHVNNAKLLSGETTFGFAADPNVTVLNGFYNSITNLRALEIREDGWRRLRLSPDQLVASGSAEESTIMNYFRLNISTLYNQSLQVSLGKIDLIKVDKGAVSVYFDDAMISQFENGFKISQKYDITGVIGVITSRPETEGWCSWSQLREMDAAGWIVCSHSHSHVEFNQNLTIADADFKKSQQILRRQGFIFGSRCFIAPFGSYNWTVNDYAKKYYAITRGQSGTLENPYNAFPQTHQRFQKYLSAKSDWTFQTFKNLIDGAIDQKKELSLTFHAIKSGPENGTYNVEPEMFELVMQYLASKRDEGVLHVVDWRDTLTDNPMSAPIKLDGSEYTHSGGLLKI